MKLSKATVKELGEILKKNYDTELSDADLERLAYSLIGYFSLLKKAIAREEVRK